MNKKKYVVYPSKIELNQYYWLRRLANHSIVFVKVVSNPKDNEYVVEVEDQYSETVSQRELLIFDPYSKLFKTLMRLGSYRSDVYIKKALLKMNLKPDLFQKVEKEELNTFDGDIEREDFYHEYTKYMHNDIHFLDDAIISPENLAVTGANRLNLYDLYKIVSQNGGMEAVTNDQLWKKLFYSYMKKTNVSYTIRTFYKKYLYEFEFLRRLEEDEYDYGYKYSIGVNVYLYADNDVYFATIKLRRNRGLNQYYLQFVGWSKESCEWFCEDVLFYYDKPVTSKNMMRKRTRSSKANNLIDDPLTREKHCHLGPRMLRNDYCGSRDESVDLELKKSNLIPLKDAHLGVRNKQTVEEYVCGQKKDGALSNTANQPDFPDKDNGSCRRRPNPGGDPSVYESFDDDGDSEKDCFKPSRLDFIPNKSAIEAHKNTFRLNEPTTKHQMRKETYNTSSQPNKCVYRSTNHDEKIYNNNINFIENEIDNQPKLDGQKHQDGIFSSEQTLAKQQMGGKSQENTAKEGRGGRNYRMYDSTRGPSNHFSRYLDYRLQRDKDKQSSELQEFNPTNTNFSTHNDRKLDYNLSEYNVLYKNDLNSRYENDRYSNQRAQDNNKKTFASQRVLSAVPHDNQENYENLNFCEQEYRLTSDQTNDLRGHIQRYPSHDYSISSIYQNNDLIEKKIDQGKLKNSSIVKDMFKKNRLRRITKKKVKIGNANKKKSLKDLLLENKIVNKNFDVDEWNWQFLQFFNFK